MKIELFLPFPPSVNDYYTKTQRGVFISPKGRKFRQQAAEVIHEQLGANFAPITDPVMVEVVWWPPDNRRRDQDNFIGKAFYDAITHAGVWADDCLVYQEFVYKGAKAAPHGAVWIRIGEAGPILPLNTFPP